MEIRSIVPIKVCRDLTAQMWKGIWGGCAQKLIRPPLVWPEAMECERRGWGARNPRRNQRDAIQSLSCLAPADQSSRQFPPGLVRTVGMCIALPTCCVWTQIIFNARAVVSRLRAFPMIWKAHETHTRQTIWFSVESGRRRARFRSEALITFRLL